MEMIKADLYSLVNALWFCLNSVNSKWCLSVALHVLVCTCLTNLLSWKTLIPMDGKEVKPKGGKFETFKWCKNLGDEGKLIPACSKNFKDAPVIERSTSNTYFSF